MYNICGYHHISKVRVKDVSAKNGYRIRCRECAREANQKHYLENVDSERMRAKRYAALYREENRERILPKLREYSKNYRVNNSSKIKEDRDRRRNSEEHLLARRAESSMRRAVIKKLLCSSCNGSDYVASAKGICYVCESREASQTDHVVPISMSGYHCNLNFRGICSECNQSKGARTWPGMPDWKDFLEKRRTVADESR
jgi:5-methylcytosine-specific restriction endonuclease McrA